MVDTRSRMEIVRTCQHDRWINGEHCAWCGISNEELVRGTMLAVAPTAHIQKTLANGRQVHIQIHHLDATSEDQCLADLEDLAPVIADELRAMCAEEVGGQP